MAREAETIQREIDRVRDELAESLDALTDRANPRRLVESGKQSVQAKLTQPSVRYALIALGALVAISVLRGLFR